MYVYLQEAVVPADLDSRPDSVGEPWPQPLGRLPFFEASPAQGSVSFEGTPCWFGLKGDQTENRTPPCFVFVGGTPICLHIETTAT